MSVSRPTALALAVIALSALCVGVGTTATAQDNSTVPSDGPAYGVDQTTFQKLWSGDVDDASASSAVENAASRTEFTRQLTKATDVPFQRPPQAASRWNSGDFGDFQPGDRDVSRHPEGASLEDGVYVEDAYVSIYAVQPSTILHRANGTVQHVAPDGQVYAIADYRIRGDDDSGPRRDHLSVLDTEIDRLELRVDGQTVDTGEGHRATLQYTDLSGSPRLTVSARILLRVRETVRRCSDWNSTATRCDGSWSKTISDTVTTSKTVSKSREVRVDRLEEIDGKRVQFPSQNAVGAAVHPNGPWSTITVDGDVRARSSWQFFTAGTPGWETMVARSESGESRTESSVRPVQVHGYPGRESATVVTDETNGTVPLEVAETWGAEHTGPTLPENVDLTPVDSYVDADSVALASESLDQRSFRELTVSGVVPGQSRTVSIDDQQTVRESTLALDAREHNATHTVVRATVTENSSGTPISSGTVTVGERTAPLNASGTAEFTLSTSSSVVRGQYEPAPWWRSSRPYSSADAAAKAPANLPDATSLLRLAVVTILWFAPVTLLVLGVDYVSGGDLLGLTHRSQS